MRDYDQLRVDQHQLDQHHDHDGAEVHDRGLAFDMARLFDRRTAFRLMAGAGAAVLAAGCGTGSDGPTATNPTATNAATSGATAAATTGTGTAGTSTASTADCETIPEETAGPYPGDGSNGPNALTQSGIVRSDIRSSFGSASGVAAGVPLTIVLNVLDTSNGCAAFGGAAVYLWHCDQEGRYSMYSEGITDQNYLRGVQEVDATGTVTFTTIFPAAYSGRWPHVHFEVYPSLSAATSAGNKVATSQLALPPTVCETVYATAGYETSVRNLAQSSLDTDNVFSDGYASQLATVTGDVSSGYAAQLSVPV